MAVKAGSSNFNITGKSIFVLPLYSSPVTKCAQANSGEGVYTNKQQEQIKPELRALFYQKDRQAADQDVAAFIEKYQKIYPSAIECLQHDLEACLTFYAFPKEHWKTIRTNNVMERLEGSVKRRSHKMAAAFRNEESCLLLSYAVIRSLKFNKLTMPASSQAQPDSAVLHRT